MDEPSPRILDGYRLTRFLGCGGFGEVWLCRSEAMGDFRAIKLIPSTRPDRLEREHESLVNYRAVAGLRSPHLVPIEHINWYEGGLCYVMPLADGTGGDGPEDPGWQPLGLDRLIEARREGEEWFSSREIVEMLRPVLLALQTLSEAKLVHRDVKPANILFFEGRPRLGDVSLLGEDAVTVTRRGTPGYAAPSWYEGGHPDMYSVGATLYALLTGNPPDKMGRTAFLWPPQGEGSLSEAEREEWRRLHAVVRRATDERVSERYVDFAAMLAAVEGGGGQPAETAGSSPRRKRLLAGTVLTLVAATAVVLIGGWLWKERGSPSGQTEAPTGTGAGAPEAGIAPLPRQVEARTHYTTEEDQEYWKLNDLFLRSTPADADPEQVLSKLDEILGKYPQAKKYPHFSIRRAATLEELERIDEAKEELRKPVNTHFNGEAMRMRTRLWERLGELGEAEKNLTRIMDTYGPSTVALRCRARVRAKRGDYAGVEADRQAALLLNPDEDAQKLTVDIEWDKLEDENPGYRHYRERLNRGEAVSGLPDADPVPRQREAGTNPTYTKIAEYTELDDLFLRTRYAEHDSEQALSKIDELIDKYPLAREHPQFSLYRAAILEELGRIDEAKEELRKPVHVHYSGWAMQDRVDLWQRLGEIEEAETSVTRILEAYGPSTVALRCRARVRAKRGDYAGVEADRQAALLLNFDADAQKQTVDAKWGELESQYPGYLEYRRTARLP